MNKNTILPQEAAFVIPRQPDGAPDWAALREEFPATGVTVYLDIARKALLPRVAAQAAADWFADIGSRATGRRAFSMDAVEDTRRIVGKTFGAAPETLALVKNTSEAVNIVAQGFDWREGDNVVISVSEHENNTFPWRPLTRRGVEIRVVEAGPDGRVTTDALRAAIDSRTRILSIAWVTYGLGERTDVDALAQICRERGVLFLVDAIQAIGVLNRRIDDLGAHVVASGGHKAQMSVAGAGLMYVAPEALDRFRPPFAAKYSFATFDRTDADPALAADAHRFEYGNPNFIGLAVQRASARMIGDIGLGDIEARVRALTELMIEEGDRLGLKLRTPRRWEQRAGIVSFDLGGASADRIEAVLEAEDIRVASKDGHLRAAAHFYNNEQDVRRFLDRLHHHLEATK